MTEGRESLCCASGRLPRAHHLDVVRPEVGREVAPRDFGAREAAARERLEQGVVDGGTPRLVRQQEPPAVREQRRGARHERLDEIRQPNDVRGEHDVRGEAPDAAAPVQGGHRDVGHCNAVDATPYDGHRCVDVREHYRCAEKRGREARQRRGAAAQLDDAFTTEQLRPRRRVGREDDAAVPRRRRRRRRVVPVDDFVARG